MEPIQRSESIKYRNLMSVTLNAGSFEFAQTTLIHYGHFYRLGGRFTVIYVHG